MTFGNRQVFGPVVPINRNSRSTRAVTIVMAKERM